METLVANLVGKTRRDTLDGREFIVAPLTLIVPGVLNGSKGPLLYPLEEITKNADAWNGIPLVVDHPVGNDGSPVSARSPSVLNERGIGHVFGVNVNGKLVAEGWFDVEKTRLVDNRILDSLRGGEPIELSTGLFTDNERAPDGAVFNAIPYSFIARNCRPDHLAILTDSKGACSVADGCGVLVNKRLLENFEKAYKESSKAYSSLLVNGDLTKNQAVLIGFVGRTDKHIHGVTLDEFGNGIAHLTNSHIHLVDKFSVKSNEGHSHALRKQSLVDSGVQNTQKEGEDTMLTENQKKEVIDGLIANTCCWEEADREVLNGFGDKKLVAMKEHDEKEKRQELVANAAQKGFEDAEGNSHVYNAKSGDWDMTKKKEPEPVVNQGLQTKVKTLDEWLADAPPEAKSAVRNAMNIENREKAQIITQVTAGLEGKSKETVINRLKDRPLEELQDLALLNPKPIEAVVPVASYLGAATPVGNEQEPLDQEDILPLPVINWSEKQAV